MYKIGKLAEISQVSKRTIDYYTQMGLLVCERTAANYRLYHSDAVDDLVFIDECKKMNMPLEEIKHRLTTVKAGKADPAALSQHAEYVRHLMQHLQTELAELCSQADFLEENEQDKVVMDLLAPAARLSEELTHLSEREK